jgi:hypothetical protein
VDSVCQLPPRDVDNRRAPVTIMGGYTEWIFGGRGTALLLPRYVRDRTDGPLSCPTGDQLRRGQLPRGAKAWLRTSRATVVPSRCPSLVAKR